MIINTKGTDEPITELLGRLNRSIMMASLGSVSRFGVRFREDLVRVRGRNIALSVTGGSPSISKFSTICVPPALPGATPVTRGITRSSLGVLAGRRFSGVMGSLVPMSVVKVAKAVKGAAAAFVAADLFGRTNCGM